MKRITASTVVFLSLIVIALGLIVPVSGQTEESSKTVKKKPLSEKEAYVILHKGTEAPFTGKFNNHQVKGVYTCRQCGARLYTSDSKFKSNCGWPSFDDEIKGAVKRQPDADGRRIEIVCAACDGHLGHVFMGERFTEKNTRHCVNSISLEFLPADKAGLEEAVFAGGCFWGVEYLFQQIPGVAKTSVGYTGGTTRRPTYKQVCTGRTGHAEALQVVYDPDRVNYETLARRFFEIHDFTQLNRQGPDIGTQYRSAVFYKDEAQKAVAEKLIKLLTDKGFKVQTALEQADKFWDAETYHQDYYLKTGKQPYCHAPKKVFD
ncbi:MAG: bifunctional methionine sulfoxide reductase B/A protein [Phycisphaerae bacterium]|nr:bifunctional methionine sulfoxide reductase B/A protein [Phycisphaerae bacterium]